MMRVALLRRAVCSARIPAWRQTARFAAASAEGVDKLNLPGSNKEEDDVDFDPVNEMIGDSARAEEPALHFEKLDATLTAWKPSKQEYSPENPIFPRIQWEGVPPIRPTRLQALFMLMSNPSVMLPMWALGGLGAALSVQVFDVANWKAVCGALVPVAASIVAYRHAVPALRSHMATGTIVSQLREAGIVAAQRRLPNAPVPGNPEHRRRRASVDRIHVAETDSSKIYSVKLSIKEFVDQQQDAESQIARRVDEMHDILSGSSEPVGQELARLLAAIRDGDKVGEMLVEFEVLNDPVPNHYFPRARSARLITRNGQSGGMQELDVLDLFPKDDAGVRMLMHSHEENQHRMMQRNLHKRQMSYTEKVLREVEGHHKQQEEAQQAKVVPPPPEQPATFAVRSHKTAKTAESVM